MINLATFLVPDREYILVCNISFVLCTYHATCHTRLVLGSQEQLQPHLVLQYRTSIMYIYNGTRFTEDNTTCL